MIIKTNSNHEIIIDNEDYILVKDFIWHALKSNKKGTSFYAASYTGLGGKKRIKMHRFLLNIDDSNILIDHINGNSLDNRRENLRITNRLGNAHNAKKRIDGITSKYKGVSKRKNDKFCAYINFKNKRYWIGTFENEVDAAKAYNKAATKFHKEFAKLNEV